MRMNGIPLRTRAPSCPVHSGGGWRKKPTGSVARHINASGSAVCRFPDANRAEKRKHNIDSRIRIHGACASHGEAETVKMFTTFAKLQQFRLAPTLFRTLRL